MQYSDFEKVTNLRKRFLRCQEALIEVTDHISTLAETDDGYACHLARHSDGSGTITDMTGCYVGTELAYSTRAILTKQIDRTIAELEDLGVTFG